MRDTGAMPGDSYPGPHTHWTTTAPRCLGRTGGHCGVLASHSTGSAHRETFLQCSGQLLLLLLGKVPMIHISQANDVIAAPGHLIHIRFMERNFWSSIGVCI